MFWVNLCYKKFSYFNFIKYKRNIGTFSNIYKKETNKNLYIQLKNDIFKINFYKIKINKYSNFLKIKETDSLFLNFKYNLIDNSRLILYFYNNFNFLIGSFFSILNSDVYFIDKIKKENKSLYLNFLNKKKCLGGYNIGNCFKFFSLRINSEKNKFKHPKFNLIKTQFLIKKISISYFAKNYAIIKLN